MNLIGAEYQQLSTKTFDILNRINFVIESIQDEFRSKEIVSLGLFIKKFSNILAWIMSELESNLKGIAEAEETSCHAELSNVVFVDDICVSIGSEISDFEDPILISEDKKVAEIFLSPD